MGLIWVELFAIFFMAWGIDANPQDIVIKKLRTDAEQLDELCRVKAGPQQRSDDCFKPSNLLGIDVIYLPEAMAKKMAAHMENAFEKKYYFHLNKQDFFHGHLLSRGPRTTYTSPQDYLSDTQLILYHSQEYNPYFWDRIEGFDPFVPHENQRSFVGRFGEESSVVPAIDLIDRSLYQPPYTVATLRSYRHFGTIGFAELNPSLKESFHEHGKHFNLYMRTDEIEERSCEIFKQIYLLEEGNGRFVSPDGVRYDVFFHCRYYREN